MNTELSWINELPNTWPIKPLKAVASFAVSNVDKHTKPGEIPVKLCNYTDVYKNDFITSDLAFMSASATKEEIKKFQIFVGDVLITKDSESWDDIAIPSLVLDTKENLVCGYHLAQIRPKENLILPEYLFRCIESKNIRIQLELASTGITRYGLPKDEIGKLKLPIPSLPEQKKIVVFLKKELNEIDALITQKEKLIILLEEKRQALITQAVTCGVNPEVKLVDSGIEWLGQVPQNWEIKKLKYIASLKSGDFISASKIKDDDNYPVYGGNGLRGHTSNYTHTGNYVLIGRQGALCGNINYAYNNFWATEHAIVCEPTKQYELIWLGELLRVMNLNQYSIAAAQPGLSIEVIENLLIPFPALSEQIEISKYINDNTSKIDVLVGKNNESIRILKERRTALISAAVTGQLNIL